MDPDLFTMIVHHGGLIKMSIDNVATYENGQIDYFDFCIGDWMSLIEITHFAERLGHENNVKFYCKVQGRATFGCFEPLENDMDVLGMVSAGLPFREAEFYIVECGNDPNDEDNGVQDGIGQQMTVDEDALHDVEVHDQAQASAKQKAVEDDSILVDSNYAQPEHAYMPKRRTKWSKDGHVGEGSTDNVAPLFDTDLEWSADDLSSGCHSDNNEASQRHKFRNFNPRTDMGSPTFSIGMVFPTADDFRKAIREYSIINNRGIRFSKNEKRRIRAVCSAGCPWVVFASSVGNDKKDSSLIIKTLNYEHTCTRAFEKKWISSRWLAEKFNDKWVDDPGWKANSFYNEVRNKTGVQVSKWQYYRSRKHAMDKIQGSEEEQYAMLWDYAEALKESNPGSTIKMKLSEVEDNPQFQRLYICFAACKRGWLAGCRRVIGLDGCHVKGPHEGQLLSAIGIDGDNSMYPIAYAAVESECAATWAWFLELLSQDLEIENSHTVTLMTDKQKGLIDSVLNALPHSEHRFCARHLYNNFKLQHKGLHLKQLMWNAAKSTTMIGYQQEMEKIKQVDMAAYQWLASKDPQHWCRAFFKQERKCDILLNNLCEVFNAAILEARDQPIITCMDMIRRYISKRLVARKEAAQKWNHAVGPRVFKIIERNKKESTKLLPEFCGDDKFEVRGRDMEQFRVDLVARTCDCNRWQLSGIPCPHAIACILSRDLHLMDYVDNFYKKENFLKAYEIPMRPMPGPNLWKKSNAIPPKPPARRKFPGRPKKSRRKEPDEIRAPSTGTKRLRRSYISMTCKICGEKGHNCVGCPNKGPSLGKSSRRATAGSSQKDQRKQKGKQVASQG